MKNRLMKMVMAKMADHPEELDYAIREVIQELVLAALSKTDFFAKAAFYGGTASRIFYDLPRFSEDLDFALLIPDPEFHWETYFKTIRNVFAIYGLNVETIEKVKIQGTDTRSAFIKENTIEIIQVVVPQGLFPTNINHNEATKVKFEIDINPPAGAHYEWLNLSDPFMVDVRVLNSSSLFAGKIAALLMRGWKNRVKGRDFFDYLFYVGKNTPINLEYLASNLRKGGMWKEETFSLDQLKNLLAERFSAIDFAEAYEEVRPFVLGNEVANHWNEEYFLRTLDRLHA